MIATWLGDPDPPTAPALNTPPPLRATFAVILTPSRTTVPEDALYTPPPSSAVSPPVIVTPEKLTSPAASETSSTLSLPLASMIVAPAPVPTIDIGEVMSRSPESFPSSETAVSAYASCG